MEPIDEARLGAWLDATLPGPSAAISARQIEGGASNVIYRVERGGRTYALRRPPAVKNDPTSNNMRRELTLLTALGKTRIPHPRLVAAGEDETVIGVPFAFMEWVDGFTPKSPLPAGYDTAKAKRGLAEELIDALALVAVANWHAVGLDGFGKPENFLQRQVDRWLSQLERARSRDLPGLDALCDWLRANTPQTQRITLIHGDYQFINVMFAHGETPKLAAIVDWESATIGDPMLDLGWVLAGWQEPGEAETHATYIDWNDFPSRKEMAQRYATQTALNIGNLNFYMALALFKLAVIMEGWYFRYKNGQTDHPAHKAMETVVPGMIGRARGFAGIA
jgi:aminoglycoside phosphotransferase (APT) family kinase protein